MAAVNADIKPNGVNQRDVVDLLYDLTTSLQGLANKLDADDAGVSTYLSGAVTAVFNVVITDTKGNTVNLAGAESSTVAPLYIISPNGLTNEALLEWMYQWVASLYAMCVLLDGSAEAALTTYVANVYTAIMTDRIVNRRGETTGASYTFTFNSVDKDGGQFVDWLYDAVNAIETLTEQLDTDGLGDTDYEALWFTNNIPLTVENSAGNRVGN
jgi:hypothetical protein